MSRSEEDFHPNRTVGRKSWLETVMNEPLDPLSILHPSTSDSTPNNYGEHQHRLTDSAVINPVAFRFRGSNHPAFFPHHRGRVGVI